MRGRVVGWSDLSKRMEGQALPARGRAHGVGLEARNAGAAWVLAWVGGRVVQATVEKRQKVTGQCKYTVHSCGVGCKERGDLTCHARLNRSPSGAPHQSFSMSYMSNQ